MSRRLRTAVRSALMILSALGGPALAAAGVGSDDLAGGAIAERAAAGIAAAAGGAIAERAPAGGTAVVPGGAIAERASPAGPDPTGGAPAPVRWNVGGRDFASLVMESRAASQEMSTFGAAVVGCAGVSLEGSGQIDSWDSSAGLYTPALSKGNALITTLDPNSDLVINSAATVKGDLLAIRNLSITNTATISGAYRAGNNINFVGNPNCPPGIVQAGGIITTPGNWWRVTKCGNPPTWEENAEVVLPEQPCDPLEVDDLVGGIMDEYYPGAGAFTSFPGSGNHTITTNSAYNGVTIGGQQIIQFDASQVDYIWVNGNFNLGASGQLHFKNPLGSENPQEIRLIIDGNFQSSGASKLYIDPGLSVRMYTTGQVHVGAGAGENILPLVTINGVVQPTFGIYTARSSITDDVTLSGSSPLTAVVYAPKTGVHVSASGHFYGAVRGRTVKVTGSGQIHYDEEIGVTGGWDGGPVFPPDMGIWLDLDETVLGFNDLTTFLIKLANLMVGDFTDVEVDLDIPTSLAYVSHDAPPGTTFTDTNSDGNPDRWSIPTIVAQDTMYLEVVMRGLNIPNHSFLEPEVVIGTWTGVDNEPSNNMATVSLEILPSPQLSITKMSSTSSILPGEPITYTTSVANLAEAPAYGVVLVGEIDSHLGLRIDTFGPGIPFQMTDGFIPSGVTLGTPEYSDDDGDNWDYELQSGAGGAPPGHDAKVTHWRIPLVGTMNADGASLQIEYLAAPL